MLILGVLSLVVGLTVDRFWLVMGSPAILTLFVYVGVRITLRRRAGMTNGAIEDGRGRDGRR